MGTMRWWQWAQVAALGVAPFVAAEYQRRMWVRDELAREAMSAFYRIRPVLVKTVEQIAEVFRRFALSMAEAGEAARQFSDVARASAAAADEWTAGGYATVSGQWQPDLWEPIFLQVWAPPIGELEMVPVPLDECWRCSRSVPREDPLGLCHPCRRDLRNL